MPEPVAGTAAREPLRVAVIGAAGRMGSEVVRAVDDADDVRDAGAIERPRRGGQGGAVAAQGRQIVLAFFQIATAGFEQQVGLAGIDQVKRLPLQKGGMRRRIRSG